MDASRKSILLNEGIVFPEGPRWHQDKLWFSDMFSGRVMTVDMQGHTEVIASTTGWISGLGWLPDGRLLVVSMNDRRLLQLKNGSLVELANLESLTSCTCNDMVVDKAGRAYVGEVGFDIHGGAPFKAASLVMVTADGTASVVDADMSVPNGSVITEDGKTLIVAESTADRLTAFDINTDGVLTNKRVWAEAKGLGPDGICLDAEGGIWIASPMSKQVQRILEGGQITECFSCDPMPIACMLGGPDRKLLFICEALPPDESIPTMSGGKIEYIEVDVPGAGLP